jgi:transposase-like protein
MARSRALCDATEHSFISTRRIWFCKGCKKQFTVKVGTIFEDSALGMDKWMIAVWLIVNAKNGISSYEIGRALGVTQKSAWFMLHRVRLAMHNKDFVKLGGPGSEVEVDETFIGGAARFMHADKRKRVITGRGPKDKPAVMGMLERGGQVRAMVVPNRKKHALQSEVRNHVAAKSAVYTDALLSHWGLGNQDFAHKTIDHAERYVDGQIHTNGMENFWSLPQAWPERNVHCGRTVPRYVDEQVFRYKIARPKSISLATATDLRTLCVILLTADSLTNNSQAKGPTRYTTKRQGRGLRKAA